MNFLSRLRAPVSEEASEEEEAPRPRRSVGEILHDRREELGLDLNSIGETLRIRPHYLAALEQGRSDELPGPTYVIGFVRAYSHHLGFDAEKVLARFRSESTVLQTRPDLTLPVPLGERSLPGAAVLVVAVILALCGYGTWYYLSTGERSRPERVAAVPASLRPPPPPDTVPAAAAPAPAAPPRAPVSAQAAPPAPSPAVQSRPTMVSGLFANAPTAAGPDANGAAPTTPPPAIVDSGTPPVAQPAASPPVAETPPVPKTQMAAATPDAAGGARVTIKAAADCWIQVRGPDQSIVFSRVLKSGETYQVPPKAGLMLRTGNAGALEIAVDGKPAPSIGGLGTLRRNVALDPDALLGGTAVHG